MSRDSAAPAHSMSVLVLAPMGRDAQLLAVSLRSADIECVICNDVESMCEAMQGGAGALLIAEEALTVPAQQVLRRCLREQPPWSAVPLVILTLPHVRAKSLAAFLSALGPLGTATIVERPIQPATLESMLRMVLLSRARQYQLGEYLSEIERQRAEIALHRDNLQALVEERTAELRKVMRKNQDAQRLAALGNMAAGIGHDIANMTLPIRIRLEPLAAAAASPEAREDIEAIGKSLDHLTNLSAGLRLMAMDPARDCASVPALDLRTWSDQAEVVLRNALPRGVAFECSLPPDDGLPGVSVSSHRLTQALFNLVQNAGEAIAAIPGHQGVVRLSVQVVKSTVPPHAGKDVVELSVSDNGPGIAPEHMERLFEPYFTTKSRAIATGMGLGMVRGLIESAGGTIQVESKPGRGATFRITLPAVTPVPAAPDASRGREAPRTAAIGLSDARQRAMTEAILKGLNVEVVAASAHRDGESGVPEADVWVTSEVSPSTVVSYLPPGTNRRLILVIGQREPVSSQPEISADDRVCRVPSNLGPGGLRDALVTVVESLSASEGGTEG